jgi:hypothetical protein
MDNSTLNNHMSLVHERMTHHHEILWEEEKHYSWWVYSILAGLVWIYTQRLSALNDSSKLIIITMGCIFGIFLSISAWRAIHLESEYLFEARQYYARCLIALQLDKPVPLLPDGKALIEAEDAKFSELECVKIKANHLDGGIRSFFKYNFIATMLMFIGFAIFSYLTLLK